MEKEGRYIEELEDGTKIIYIKGKLGQKRVRVSPGSEERVQREVVRSVTHGYKDKVVIKGVGYRAQVVGTTLEISLGHKIPYRIEIPSAIKIKVKGGGMIIEGMSNTYSILRQFMSTIVEQKPARKDKYNGKGLSRERRKEEVKAGKVSKRIAGEGIEPTKSR